MDLLMRSTVFAVALAAAGCSDADVPVPVWTSVETIEGRFRPEVNQAATPAAPQDRWRVVTYNAQHGIDAAFAPYLLAHRDLATADVLLLQEAAAPGDGPSDAALLAATLGMGHVYAPLGEHDEGTGGLAILSRFTLRDIEVLFLEPTHMLHPVESVARTAMAVTIDAASGPVRVVNVHLDFGLNLTERILQLRPAIIDAPIASPIVVGGDFNTNDYIWVDGDVPLFPLDSVADTAQAPELDEYVRILQFKTPTARFGDTWSGLPEDQRLDAIFTRGVEVGAGAVDRTDEVGELSDHWPLWLDIVVR
jgi:endonuclease/exonuclease/phosphatase family metal-dependent hydrolase